MLDIRLVREEPERVRQGLADKGAQADLDGLLALDQQRRSLLTEVEALKKERNNVSKEIGRLKREGGDISDQTASMKEAGRRIAAMDEETRSLDDRLNEILLGLPNLPHPDAPRGTDESGNVEIRTWSEPRVFAFTPKPHWELGEQLGILDLPRGARMSGSGFPLLVGQGAWLQRALIRFMLDVHIKEHGYTEVAPPYLCHTDSMIGTGQLPKMVEDMYRLEGEDLWLIPTAEVPVTNLYRDEIIEKPLPIYITAYTPCFRREAGAAGKDTRGINRVHQFDKVEMVKFVHPDTSYDEWETLTADAEDILQRLELPYRVIELCCGDISFAAARCNDIELWAPSQERWLEVSSCSNFEDFQARRANIRFRDADNKTRFVHTLNGSGVALPRLLIALLENGQQADGSVDLPTVLHPYMDGVKKLELP